nr:hypothetical protein [uncultured bacterium]
MAVALDAAQIGERCARQTALRTSLSHRTQRLKTENAESFTPQVAAVISSTDYFNEADSVLGLALAYTDQ